MGEHLPVMCWVKRSVPGMEYKQNPKQTVTYAFLTDSFCITADQLQPGSCALENSVFRTVRFPLGHLPVLFPAERWWHSEVRVHLLSQEGGEWQASRGVRSPGLLQRLSFVSPLLSVTCSRPASPISYYGLCHEEFLFHRPTCFEIIDDFFNCHPNLSHSFQLESLPSVFSHL